MTHSEISSANSREQVEIMHQFNETTEVAYKSDPEDVLGQFFKQMESGKTPRKRKKSKKNKIQDKEHQITETVMENMSINASTKTVNSKQENNDNNDTKNVQSKLKSEIPSSSGIKRMPVLNKFSESKEVSGDNIPKIEDLSEMIMKLMDQEEKQKKKKKSIKESIQGSKPKPAKVTSRDAQASASTNDVSPKKKTKKKPVHTESFPEYVSPEEIRKILKKQSLENAEYIEGCLRINPKFYKHAYLSIIDEPDIIIVGVCDRNCALDGDIVVVHVNPPEKWQSSSNGRKRKTGVVVSILKKVHPRTAIGYLKEMKNLVVCYPRDKRIPLLRIKLKSLPKKFLCQPSFYEETLFMVKITHWEKPQFAIGNVIEMIGNTGSLEAETRAILLENTLDVTPYSKNVIGGLPSADYVLSENDLKDREDWRQECVFTIDPATAVDLDDAVSYKSLDNGNCEIGVHIADVTHFLEFLSPLDTEVAKRATTVYLTNNVYHMLPKQLCQVCSLLPGEDKLGFSVIWEMTQKAEIVKHRFVKTVLKSCCQMAYQHAQMFIENPESNWPDDFLNIKGNFSVSDLSDKVNSLHRLATLLRAKRYANGALRMDLPKLHVAIDKTTGLPTSCSIEEHTDSNRLIEEFMLLANMTVAGHLYNTVPEIALLRNHKPPSQILLKAARDTLQKFGIHLDIESAGALHDSIKRYEMGVELESDEIKTIMKYRMMVINQLCAKSMTRATYICGSGVEAEEMLRHYALNVPLYTHFTSPIRRYSDCVVHRLLYSTMQNVFQPENWSKKLCAQIAENCNVKKYHAKLAQEQSTELYFTQLVNLKGPLVTTGIVVDVKEQSIDVILCKIGIKLKILLMQFGNTAKAKYSTEHSVPTITIFWKNPPVTQVINIFTLLNLRVEADLKLFRLVGFPLPPEKEIDSC